MADILIDNQTAPTTPASGKSVLFVDSTAKRVAQMDDAGFLRGVLSTNGSTAATTLSSADTYVAGSAILIPSFGMKAGQFFKWKMSVSKTGAGTAAAIYQVRIGAGASTSDTSRASGTATIAQTANAGSGIIEVLFGVRSVSASGQCVLAVGVSQVYGATAGTQVFGSGIINVPATFDNTAQAGLYCGLSINPGASGVWTVDFCASELIG